MSKGKVCIDGEQAMSAEVLERIERDYGVVCKVQIDGSDETIIANESQLLSGLEVTLIKTETCERCGKSPSIVNSEWGKFCEECYQLAIDNGL